MALTRSTLRPPGFLKKSRCVIYASSSSKEQQPWRSAPLLGAAWWFRPPHAAAPVP